MELVHGQTLDWLMRLEYNATGSPFDWIPIPLRTMRGRHVSHDLSVFERHLSDYADAIGLVLSLPVPMHMAPGPVGGGYSRHVIFGNESLGENKSPREYHSVQELTEHINEVAYPLVSRNRRRSIPY
ncbi:hypothetical protein GGR57DRAFT_451649 [Xylariaceae sp. FL1272]|nr:hypothetical protein GGR57DRAFT_451649 [Xylariaceae sp. FL1272]